MFFNRLLGIVRFYRLEKAKTKTNFTFNLKLIPCCFLCNVYLEKGSDQQVVYRAIDR